MGIELVAKDRVISVEHIARVVRNKGIGVELISPTTRGIGRGLTPIAAAVRGMVKPRKIALVDIEVSRRTPLYEWFKNPTIHSTNALSNPPTSPVQAQSSVNSKEEMGKRPKTIGMGVFVDENNFTTYDVSVEN